MERRKAYREYLQRTGKLGRINRSLSTFYGYTPNGDADSSQVTQSGEQGEIADVVVNQYAALVKQGLVLITSDKPAFKAVAGNTDSKSLAQSTLGDGLIEYYGREAGVDDVEYSAAFRALLMSEGHVAVTWDAMAGKPYAVDPDTQQEVNEGDAKFRAFGPLDVFFDVDAPPGKRPWMGLEWPVNKWDLIAQYPERKEDILSVSPERDDDHWVSFRGARKFAKGDYVRMQEVYVAPSPAVPAGRLMLFLSPKCVLFDGPLPYDDVPIYSMSPEETIGDNTGHTSAFDLLGLQQGVDMTATIATTNLQAGGVSNFWTQPNAGLTVKQLAGGMNHVESMVKPEVIDGVQISSEVGAWAGLFVSWMQTLSGVNAAIRGEPDKGMPAQAMAFLQAAAIQYHSRLQSAFTKLREKVRTANLRLLKRYANTRRIALIAGKANTWTRKEFTADDLSDIDRVTVETVNPILRTLQGRTMVADKLLELGQVRPTQYITMLNTGKLEPMFEGEQANLLRIRRNRELLQEGIGLPPMALDPLTEMPAVNPMTRLPEFEDDGQQHVRPLKTDTHWLDIPEYLSVLATPGARENAAVVKAVTEVVEYQLALWRQMDPALIAVLGGQPAPAVVPMAAMGAQSATMAQSAAEGAMSGTAPPESGATGGTQPGPAGPADAAGVRLPGLPKTPNGQTPQMAGVA